MKIIYFFIICSIGLLHVSCNKLDAKYKVPGVLPFEESYFDSGKYLEGQNLNGIDIDYQKLLMEEDNDWSGITEIEISKIEARNKRDPKMLVLLSTYFLSRGDINKSQALCEVAKKCGASSIEYHILRSKIHARKGQNDIAIDQINRAILVNRFDAELYKEKGQLYLDFGDTLSAINYLEKSVFLDSTKLDPCILLVNLYGLNGDYQSANKWLGLGLKADPENTRLKYAQSDMYRNAGLDDQANVSLNHLLDDGNVLAGVRLINFFETKSENDSVINYANKILVIDTLNVSALIAKGDAFENKGYLSSSMNYYEKVLTIDSTNQEAVKRVQKINGKIAYLRKIREQKESIPTFDSLVPKKKKTLN